MSTKTVTTLVSQLLQLATHPARRQTGFTVGQAFEALTKKAQAKGLAGPKRPSVRARVYELEKKGELYARSSRNGVLVFATTRPAPAKKVAAKKVGAASTTTAGALTSDPFASGAAKPTEYKRLGC